MATQRDVIARYGNFYRGDDDLFTHGLILRSGQCWLLGQGLRPVTLRSFKAPVSQFKKLTATLKTIPASLAVASIFRGLASLQAEVKMEREATWRAG
jgi:hypothetical protein